MAYRPGTLLSAGGRVLARISKMPIQNSNIKISAHPNLPTHLLQILIPTTFNSLLCQKGNLHVRHPLKDGLLGKSLDITPFVVTYTVSFPQKLAFKSTQAIVRSTFHPAAATP